jgi:hypothetical protein
MLRPQPRPSVRQPGCDQTGQTESLIPLKPLSTRASPPSNVQSIDQSTTKGVSTQREGPEPLNLLSKYWAFSGLINYQHSATYRKYQALDCFEGSLRGSCPEQGIDSTGSPSHFKCPRPASRYNNIRADQLFDPFEARLDAYIV